MPTTFYTKEHEFIRVEDGSGMVGITDYAQGQLGDVVFVELPLIGRVVTQGAEAAVVESVKAASGINAPASGEVIEVNNALEETPAIVNEDPLDKGWFFKIRLRDATELDSLMDEDAYQDYVKSLE
ncbi:glycine cleavage system protein GcvH [Methylocapsa acidiphila]|uniref:glycine cleavage system protein GcvH n=1 Tax=Methylocapsa acidiphila TaxID=133552 RepID=UPI0004056A22|nr:glycine cleavage system protein GcvH [Methylocapsa acidiphila]